MDRIFLALELPDATRRSLARWQKRELRDPAVLQVAERDLRIPVLFLGWRGDAEAKTIAATLKAMRIEAPTVFLEPPVQPVPKRGRAGIYVLRAQCSHLEQTKRRLESRLEMEGVDSPGRRVYTPHLLVGRVRSEGHRPMAVKERPGPLPEKLCRPFDVVRATLYRSQTRPQGSEYTPLAQVELSRPGSGEVIK